MIAAMPKSQAASGPPATAPIPTEAGSVAIVHDYLNQPGGAERVVLELARIWPQAPIYTSIYRPQSTFPEFRHREIRSSALNRIPVDRAFRALLPLYPAAFRSLGTLDQELVISSSSGWAHAVRTAPGSTHVVYCHTPARWLYKGAEYMPSRAARIALTPVNAALERWDRRAANRANLYLANSENTRARIRAAYGIEAEVVNPPVDTERFEPRPRGERLLVVSRLLPYKRVDLVVEAAMRAGIPLDVVGTGPAMDDLRTAAGPSVTFHGSATDAEIVELMEACRAVVVAGTEDFGIVSVEAQAAGKPVVAFGAGGSLETVVEGVTGVFFREPSVDAVVEAIRRAEELTTGPEEVAAQAERFSRAAFRERMLEAVAHLRAKGA
jgi:glycosyltransferase involved in cell wall biosynthesis